jgi:hypothetical protein
MIELVCLQKNLGWEGRVLQPGDAIMVDSTEAAHLLNLGGVTPQDRCFARKTDYEAQRGGK